MTDEKTCYNCGNKNCNLYYSTAKPDVKRHFETYEYKDFDCVNHNKWEELKMEEIHTDNTKTLQNALDRIKELEKENAELKADNDARKFAMVMSENVEKKLRQENAELKENFRICEKNADTYFDNFTKAKGIIKNIIRVTWGEGWNYSLEWKVKAEQFLEEGRK